MILVAASLKKNENKVSRNLYPEFGGMTLTQKFSIGDNVRIKKKTNLFEKGCYLAELKRCLDFLKLF